MAAFRTCSCPAGAASPPLMREGTSMTSKLFSAAFAAAIIVGGTAGIARAESGIASGLWICRQQDREWRARSAERSYRCASHAPVRHQSAGDQQAQRPHRHRAHQRPRSVHPWTRDRSSRRPAHARWASTASRRSRSRCSTGNGEVSFSAANLQRGGYHVDRRAAPPP